MTPEQAVTLLYFAPNEWRHADLVDWEFAKWLDIVRLYSRVPLILTSDARTPAENAAAGGAPTSLHLLGRAVDIHWDFDDKQLFQLLDAICDAGQGRSVELEVVPTGAQRHVHVGLFPDEKHGSTFFVGPST
jgi:uncharacterized protein YcbK (DUF882 family)